MDEDEFIRDEKLFGDLPYIPHSSWRHDFSEKDTAATGRIDASESCERLGL